MSYIISKDCGSQNPRLIRAFAILSQANQIKQVRLHTFRVKSQSGNGEYVVTNGHGQYECTCPDFVYRHDKFGDCKHVLAIRYYLTWRNEKIEITVPKGLIIPKCEYCNSSNVIKYTKRETKKGKVQVYECKDCERYFSINDGFRWKHFTPEIITSALDLYFKGISLRQISDHIQQFHNRKVSHSTVLRWIQHYMEMIEDYVSQFKPELSGILHVDETAIFINGKKHWIWNVLDEDTRFLVASHISENRSKRDAKRVFNEVKEIIPNPKAIIVDGLRSYVVAHKKVFKDQNNLIRDVGIQGRINNNSVERLHGTFKHRTKTMRGIRSERNPKTIATYYNYLRGHSSLDGKTPSNLKLDGNKWMMLISKSVR